MIIVPPDGSNPVVEDNNTMTQQFRTWVNNSNSFLPITGTGSPEGVVKARQFALYLDEFAGTGAIEYRKMQPSIGGDVTKGWVLV